MVGTPMTVDVDLLERWHRLGYERVVAGTGQFVELVRPLTDDQLQAPVPDLSWRVIDVVAHMASVYRRYTTNPERARDRADLARLNARDAAELGGDLPTLAAELDRQVTVMASLVDLPEPTREYPFHAGQTVTIAGGWGNLLGELLAHGDDVARALGLSWNVPDADLEPFWRFTARALPGWLAPAARSVTDRWRLELGFETGPVDVTFDNGSVAIDDGSAAGPDHVISGAAGEFTLAVPYRRRPAPDPTSALLQSRIEPL